jgi:ArsR family metal-binding transcriptional regulator
MYLETIILSRALPCLAEPGKIIVIGKPSRSLEEVLPYLATLPGIISFNPETCSLTMRRQPGFLTLNPDEVFITQVKDSTEGLELIEALKDAINVTWEHRAELTPATSIQRAPRLLDVWQLLPRTNCGECGEATCMAFAAGLLQSKREGSECPILAGDTEFADRRAVLEAITKN